MKFILNESKLESALSSYFFSDSDLFPLQIRPTWNELGLAFFVEPDNVEDELTSDSFVYFPNKESYEFEETYEDKMFPLIEMNWILYRKLKTMFGEQIIQNQLLDWINKTYKLDSVSIFQD